MTKSLDRFGRSWDHPFRDMMNLQRSLDNLWGNWTPAAQSSENGSFMPACEVEETDNAFEFKFDLPGIPKETIKVDLHENTLTVSGERKEERKSDEKNHHFSEVTYGSFMRSFTLPNSVDAEKADANFRDGVLQVSVPKTNNGTKRQINVK